MKLTHTHKEAWQKHFCQIELGLKEGKQRALERIQVIPGLYSTDHSIYLSLLCHSILKMYCLIA